MTPNNLDQFSPIKWQDFKTVPTPSDRGMTVRVFGWLCGLAVIGGILFAVNP